MKRLIVITALMLALIAPVALGDLYDDKWERVCIGNVLVENVTVTVDEDDMVITKNLTCQHGCDAGRKICTNFGGEPGNAVPLELFLVFQVFALAFLLVSFAIEKPVNVKLILALMAVILLFPLGLLSGNILVGGVASVLVWLTSPAGG